MHLRLFAAALHHPCFVGYMEYSTETGSILLLNLSIWSLSLIVSLSGSTQMPPPPGRLPFTSPWVGWPFHIGLLLQSLQQLFSYVPFLLTWCVLGVKAVCFFTLYPRTKTTSETWWMCLLNEISSWCTNISNPLVLATFDMQTLTPNLASGSQKGQDGWVY